MPTESASRTALSPTCNSNSPFTDRLPKEIRFIIYDILISQNHEIEYCNWASYVCNPGILGPLSETCKKTREEIELWYSAKSLSRLYRCPEFGIVDPRITAFWKRLFPFNVAEVDFPFTDEDLQNHPVDPDTMPPFGRSNDIRCVPNVGETAPQTEEKMEEIVASHRKHWKVMKTGRRPIR